MEYCHLHIRPRYRYVWGKSFGNEIGRLAQGMSWRVDGTNTLSFIDKEKIPQDRRNYVTVAFLEEQLQGIVTVNAGGGHCHWISI